MTIFLYSKISFCPSTISIQYYCNMVWNVSIPDLFFKFVRINAIKARKIQYFFFYSDNTSPPFFLLYLRKSTVADMSIAANPSKNGGRRLNGLSSFVMMFVNWNTIGYS